MALIAGVQAPQGRVMGHAGAFVGAGENNARAKVRALEDAGVVITNHPSKFGEGMKRLLAGQQKRHMHTSRRPIPRSNPIPPNWQRQNIHFPENQSNRMLQELGVPLTESEDPHSRDNFLTVSVDRTNYTPCVITSFSISGESAQTNAKTYPLGMAKHVDDAMFSSIATDLKCQKESFDSLTKILSSMVEIFFSKEAFSLTTRISRNNKGELAVARSSFTFDDAAFRSGKRHSDIQEMRDTKDEVPEEVEAEKDGIVYIK